MSDAQNSETKTEAANPAASTAPAKKIHRVCIQCNNMFVVTADNYAAKQCPNCHKG